MELSVAQLMRGMSISSDDEETTSVNECFSYQSLIRKCNWCDVEMLKRIEAHLADNRCTSYHKPLKNITVKNYPGTTPLLVACYLGQFDVVQHIVENWDVDVNEPGKACQWDVLMKATPLLVATTFGHEKIISYLIENGAVLSTHPSEPCWNDPYPEMAPLHEALYHLDENEHKKAIIRLLIKSGADPSAFTRDRRPMWTFFDKVTRSDIPIEDSSFALMVDMGMRLDQRCPATGQSVLHDWASDPNLRHSLERIKYLHAQGASIYEKDGTGLCPLKTTALGHYSFPKSDVLEYLLEQPGYSQMDQIDALELAGATILIKMFNDTVAEYLDGHLTGYLIQDEKTNEFHDIFESQSENPIFSQQRKRDYAHSVDSTVLINKIDKTDARYEMRQSSYWVKSETTNKFHFPCPEHLFTISYREDNPYIQTAFGYWKRATQLRLNGGETFRKTTLFSGDVIEWTTMSELDRNQKGPIFWTLQACLTLLRFIKSNQGSFVEECAYKVKCFMSWLKKRKDSRLLDISWAALEAFRHCDSSYWAIVEMKIIAFTKIIDTLSLLEEIGCPQSFVKTLSRTRQFIDYPVTKQQAIKTKRPQRRPYTECSYFYVVVKLLEITASQDVGYDRKKKVKRYFDSDIRSFEGKSLLLHTCRYLTEPLILPVVKLLLKAGADADQVDHLGNSGLHYLGMNDKEPLESPAALRLVRSGCNPNRVNKEGKTALELFRLRLGETTPLPSWNPTHDIPILKT